MTVGRGQWSKNLASYRISTTRRTKTIISSKLLATPSNTSSLASLPSIDIRFDLKHPILEVEMARANPAHLIISLYQTLLLSE